jgi:mitofilin
MSALRNEMENEMRSQLRRQAAAHSDHISDVLEVQQKELGRMNTRALDEAVTSEKSAHKQVRLYFNPST